GRDVLNRDEVRAKYAARVVGRGDVRMIEVAHEARLVEEELDLLALHRRQEALERDLLDLAVAARQFSAMHGRHAACAELLVDDVRAIAFRRTIHCEYYRVNVRVASDRARRARGGASHPRERRSRVRSRRA